MIRMSQSIYDECIAHAKKCYPQEACGFLAGRDGRVKQFIVLENMEHSSVSYAMDPKEQLRAFRLLEETKQELLGILHSHVASGAEPSQRDKTLAFYPEVSYLIVSLSDMENPVMKSFRIENEKATEEKVMVQ